MGDLQESLTMGGVLQSYEESEGSNVIEPSFQPGRVGRPRCPRCKRVGHRFNRCKRDVIFGYLIPLSCRGMYNI
ncbi:predicted protein [Arabidopsis lyrata subsp. lyrata]|uniref:Predicted protein n=1 Tax=Arabidopsis lyrata subsp. lyrata TaxID=81972 RepID=D7LPA3_ARALL|nr:predicted protein [Arabidopsis lyrata subsp. lyrata]